MTETEEHADCPTNATMPITEKCESAAVVIAAIAPIGDASELQAILTRCVGLDAGSVTVLRDDRSNRAVSARERTHFVGVHTLPAAWRSSHGTGVPGSAQRLEMSAYFTDAPDSDRLRRTGIAYDAAQYYDTAMNIGRSIVTCVVSGESVPSLEERFRACGFTKIRHFSLAERR